MPPVLAAGRVRQGAYATTDADGLTGAFTVTCLATGRRLNVIASDGRDWAEAGLEGEPWEHVSVSVYLRADRCPAWPEMAWVKSLFWGPEEAVIQIHPPESEYVNFHAGCLHLWRPIGVAIPPPPSITVGPRP